MIAAPLGGRLIGKVKPSYVIFVSTFFCGIGILLALIHRSALDRDRYHHPDVHHGVRARLRHGAAHEHRRRRRAADEIGEASAILALVRNISGAFGVAIFSTLLDNSINGNVFAIAQQSILNGVGQRN